MVARNRSGQGPADVPYLQGCGKGEKTAGQFPGGPYIKNRTPGGGVPEFPGRG